jgi:hypothetical protein
MLATIIKDQETLVKFTNFIKENSDTIDIKKSYSTNDKSFVAVPVVIFFRNRNSNYNECEKKIILSDDDINELTFIFNDYDDYDYDDYNDFNRFSNCSKKITDKTHKLSLFLMRNNIECESIFVKYMIFSNEDDEYFISHENCEKCEKCEKCLFCCSKIRLYCQNLKHCKYWIDNLTPEFVNEHKEYFKTFTIEYLFSEYFFSDNVDNNFSNYVDSKFANVFKELVICGSSNEDNIEDNNEHTCNILLIKDILESFEYYHNNILNFLLYYPKIHPEMHIKHLIK